MNPAPVDLSRLKGILGAAKKVMKATDATNPIKLSEQTMEQAVNEEREDTYSQPLNQPYTEERVMASGLPDIVKQAMINNRIPQLTGMPQNFTAKDILDEDELHEKPMDFTRRPTPKRVNEQIAPAATQQAGMITISESALEALINKKLLEFFTTHYNKSITENAIKTTISTLIKEGKIQGKKKTI